METSFPKYDHKQPYGMFGYPAFCCDMAIMRDNAQMAEECWRNGWMDAQTRTLFGTVIEKCEKQAPAVAEKLRELGPCKNSPLMYPYAQA